MENTLRIYTDLFGICDTGIKKAWIDKRLGSCHMENTQMQPILEGRIRSGSLSLINCK